MFTTQVSKYQRLGMSVVNIAWHDCEYNVLFIIEEDVFIQRQILVSMSTASRNDERLQQSSSMTSFLVWRQWYIKESLYIVFVFQATTGYLNRQATMVVCWDGLDQLGVQRLVDSAWNVSHHFFPCPFVYPHTGLRSYLKESFMCLYFFTDEVHTVHWMQHVIEVNLIIIIIYYICINVYIKKNTHIYVCEQTYIQYLIHFIRLLFMPLVYILLFNFQCFQFLTFS